MTLPEGSGIDAALVDYLLADATLTSLMPDGVHFDEASGPGATGLGCQRFIVLRALNPEDIGVFAQAGYQLLAYEIRAIGHSNVTDEPTMSTVAEALHARLEMAQLTVAGYPGGVTLERSRRIRTKEPDPVSKDWCWYHRGGFYLAHAS